MADNTKRGRGDALDERRPVRRDPRAEPESVPPKDHDLRTHKTPPESEMRRAAAARISPLPDPSDVGGSSRRPPESGPSLEGAGAAGMAPLRRQIAALQMELSLMRAELASEQEDRANDSEKMGTLLDRIAGDDAVTQSLRDDLARERSFIEELRVSVQDKYADCSTLRQQLTDAEERLAAKERDEASERDLATQRAERAEQDLSEVRQELEALRHDHTTQAAECQVLTQRAERAEQDLSEVRKELEALRQDHATRTAELEKASHALKTSNMKAFAANRQLESWKSESFRMIEQTRAEQGAVIESLRAEHSKSMEALRREAGAGLSAAAKSLEMIQAALALPLPSGSGGSSPDAPADPPALVRAPGPPRLPPAANSPPTTPKQPASAPSLEVAELDMCAEDLIEELSSKGD
jgi:hypothetical protein